LLRIDRNQYERRHRDVTLAAVAYDRISHRRKIFPMTWHANHMIFRLLRLQLLAGNNFMKYKVSCSFARYLHRTI